MTDFEDDRTPVDGTRPAEDRDDAPTIACERCGREWSLDYELDDLRVGNQAVEQFALDHRRHTGHFPDGISTWQAECRQCPETAERLDEAPARRWAEVHARHTRHAVEVTHASLAEPEVIESE